jgi:hypothetical protein
VAYWIIVAAFAGRNCNARRGGFAAWRDSGKRGLSPSPIQLAQHSAPRSC